MSILGTYKRNNTYLRVFAENGESNAIQVSGADIQQPVIETKAVRPSNLKAGWVEVPQQEFVEAYKRAQNIQNVMATV